MSQRVFIPERRTTPKRGRTDHTLAVEYAKRGWVGLKGGKRYDTRADWEGDLRFKGVFTLAKAAIDRSGNNVA